MTIASPPAEPPQLNEDDYPGLEPAYTFVLPSYQWMLSRYEAADSRLQALVTLIATVTFAVPATAKAVIDQLSFDSPWFVTAVLVGLLTALAGVIARARGSLTLVDPAKVYDTAPQLSRFEFHRRALHQAGEHFDRNRRVIEQKSQVVTGMTIAFVAELGLLILWLVAWSQAHPS